MIGKYFKNKKFMKKIHFTTVYEIEQNQRLEIITAYYIYIAIKKHYLIITNYFNFIIINI